MQVGIKKDGNFESCTASKMNFSIKHFFSKYDQIRSKVWIWSHLLNKCLIETLFFLCGAGQLVTASKEFNNSKGVIDLVKIDQSKVVMTDELLHKCDMLERQLICYRIINS